MPEIESPHFQAQEPGQGIDVILVAVPFLYREKFGGT